MRRLHPRVVRRAKLLALIAATLPLAQFIGCLPDILGAFSFELQNLINNVIFQISNTFVRNLFRI
jgi:hypothetical protein